MFCKNCGKAIDDDARFCSSCGTPTDNTKAKENKHSSLEYTIHHKSGIAEVYSDHIVIKKSAEAFALRPASEKTYRFSDIKAIDKHSKAFLQGAFIHFDLGEGRSPDGHILFDYAIEFRNNRELDEAYNKIKASFDRYNNL